jgi:nucleotide-binding universal stress UspA family protein
MHTGLFHRIVVPADFSNCSEEAWALAQRVAESLGSEVVLVHVFVALHPYGDVPIGHADATGQAVESARKWVSEELNKMVARARGKGINARMVMRNGVPHQEIVELAKEESTDIVIMGTHGRSGLSRVLLGSVAERVIHFAPCPVLTVRKAD